MHTTTRPLALALALIALPLLAACGGGGWVETGIYIPIGTVYAENSTATIPDTIMVDFALWKSGNAGGANVLPYALGPGEFVAVADVDEDFYDADALMDDGFGGYVETWFDVFVPGDEATTFFAF